MSMGNPATPPLRPSSAGERSFARTAGAMLVMCLAVLAVYVPLPTHEGDNTLAAMDYLQLHARRMRYAREALLAPQSAGTLPGWYSRELLGTPFWSNSQTFPFIPTRLLVLFMFDPATTAYPVAVCLSAVLSAVFTFGLARRLR